jgi:hypothetical protein
LVFKVPTKNRLLLQLVQENLKVYACVRLC